MKFTDIFIKKPVLASVVSLLIVVMGLSAIAKLPLRQYPAMQNTTITITTDYPGASADVVQGFITTPLSQAVGSADGIDYLEATSSSSISTITAHIKLNYDPNAALTNITGKVDSVINQLPTGSQSPVIDKETGQTFPDLIMGFTATTMSPEQITAYIQNVVMPKLYSVGGISNIVVYGAKTYAMRIWLNPQKMALLGVSPQDVQSALQTNNIQSAPGQLKQPYMYTDIQAQTDLHTVAQFDNLVIKNAKGHLIRVQDIGYAEMGSQSYDSQVYYNGKQAVFAGVSSAPGANPLTVVDGVIKALPGIKANFPPGLKVEVVHDSTQFIRVSIKEVIETIIAATLIVIIVIYLFLGSLRAVLIPVAAIPLSLIGVCFLMLMMGYSINLLTLLAMVLAIGLVVDDAVVVLENIYRHVEEGLTPFQAAIKGTREIAGPVMVMTTTLAAVFAPIGFVGGLTGALFGEFAFTLAAAVVISGIVALTFSPMLCSKVISADLLKGRFVQRIDKVFHNLKGRYHRRLQGVLDYRPLVLLVAVVVLSSCFFLFTGSQSELAPTEDQGFIGLFANAPSSANLPYVQQFNADLMKIFNDIPETDHSFIIDGMQGPNTVFGGIILTPWGQRHQTQMQITPLLQNQLNNIPGLQAFAFQMPPLPGVDFGLPLQFVITTTDSQQALFQVMQAFKAKAAQSGMFLFLNSSLQFDKPQIQISIDQNKAAALGISMSEIAASLNTMLGGNLVNYFSQGGYSYQVIPQVPDDWRRNVKQLQNINIPTSSGSLVPLSSIVSFSNATEPSSLYQFQQLNGATLEGMLKPGYTLGQGLAYLQGLAKETLPQNMSINYAGQSRQFVEEGDVLIYAFLLALIIIFLVLAAQFESFRDPLVVLVSVPLSICGALIPLYLGLATINIYTEIGLITLIGLISKHGILMVEFANRLQDEQGLSIREAIEQSAATRLRPILMTTFCMVFGILPLLLATGAGAVSRFDVGLVITAGMTIGTCFTLFVVPTMYTYIAEDRVAAAKRKAEKQVMPEDE
ncbi:MAG: efflux RND transporter permease subunit [Gammaproteobacteria bacterium]|nr:efflux RND transporter permease subunit [Gammaproteobacteria bacterium]